MNLNYLLNNYSYKVDDLLNYGFYKENDTYKYVKYILNAKFKVIISICNKEVKAQVIEESTQEEYLPFKVLNATGNVVSMVKNEVNKIIIDLENNCFINDNMQDKLISFIKEKYHVEEEYPWDEYPKYCTFKVNNKWFALFMNVTGDKLKLKNKKELNILNIKIPEDKILSLIDYENFFPAYHMNKKYWLTIVLSNKLDYNIITSLVDESYNLVKE